MRDGIGEIDDIAIVAVPDGGFNQDVGASQDDAAGFGTNGEIDIEVAYSGVPSIYRDRILRARSMTPEERFESGVAQTNSAMSRILEGAMWQTGISDQPLSVDAAHAFVADPRAGATVTQIAATYQAVDAENGATLA